VEGRERREEGIMRGEIGDLKGESWTLGKRDDREEGKVGQG
jgi:hypothetical protein